MSNLEGAFWGLFCASIVIVLLFGLCCAICGHYPWSKR